MIDKKIYNTFEFSGALLVPGFSIYLLEVIKENNKWFYIGMTGDPHYPSARSAFHRLSGHLELSKRSTQNQLLLALKEKVGIKNEEDMDKLTFRMHFFAIPGFKKINDKALDNETVNQLKKTEGYKEYKKIQSQVSILENALIYELKGSLLNKTHGKIRHFDDLPFPEIYKNILELVNNE